MTECTQYCWVNFDLCSARYTCSTIFYAVQTTCLSRSPINSRTTCQSFNRAQSSATTVAAWSNHTTPLKFPSASSSPSTMAPAAAPAESQICATVGVTLLSSSSCCCCWAATVENASLAVDDDHTRRCRQCQSEQTFDGSLFESLICDICDIYWTNHMQINLRKVQSNIIDTMCRMSNWNAKAVNSQHWQAYLTGKIH